MSFFTINHFFVFYLGENLLEQSVGASVDVAHAENVLTLKQQYE